MCAYRYTYQGLGFRLSREYGNEVYVDQIGIIFPDCLLTASKLLNGQDCVEVGRIMGNSVRNWGGGWRSR